MAAAEYYNVSIPQSGPQYPSYQQSSYQQPQRPQGSTPPGQSPNLYPASPQSSAPPAYEPIQHEHSVAQKPTVHFAPSPAPPQQSHSQSPRPSFSNSGNAPPHYGQYLAPNSQHPNYAQHNSYHGSSQALAQPPHMRPYMNENLSQSSLNSGYSSDPERRRRRRQRRHDRRDEDGGSSREERSPRKNRSRSSNADGWIGAAGGGLIGDLIFPGLGTVGGAVAGWIGGKDYGRHRKDREGKREREQKEWEHRFRDRSNSDDKRYRHDGHGRRRHHSEY